MPADYLVIIPTNLKSPPNEREISAAWILAEYFQKNVKVLDRAAIKTADFLIGRQYWELKSLQGGGKRTIQHAMHRASDQSSNVIIDARKTKMHINKVRSQIRHEFSHMSKIKRLLLIEKDGKVVELFKK